MEHNGKFYFVWPERTEWTAENPGLVYEVNPEAIDGESAVALTDEILLRLDWREDPYQGTYLVIKEVSEFDRMKWEKPIYKATRVFGVYDEAPVFEGGWEQLLEFQWKLVAAAAANQLFVIRLTPKVYREMTDGGFEWFKRSFPRWVQGLLALNEGSSIDFDVKGPVIDLYRIGRCP